MDIKEFDVVLLKDGREATIVEAPGPDALTADVGSSPKDWETIFITINDIERRICDAQGRPYIE